MHFLGLASIALVTCLGAVHGYSSGAPPTACGDMTPKHHTPAQTSPIPYALQVVSNKKVVRGGEKVSLKITPNKAGVTTFQGFLVQARVGDRPFGKFTAASDVKVIDCGTGKENAATQVNAKDKQEVNLVWTAPKDLSETVTFYVTVAKTFEEFWVNQPTKSITVKS